MADRQLTEEPHRDADADQARRSSAHMESRAHACGGTLDQSLVTMEPEPIDGSEVVLAPLAQSAAVTAAAPAAVTGAGQVNVGPAVAASPAGHLLDDISDRVKTFFSHRPPADAGAASTASTTLPAAPATSASDGLYA
jgi:hypothetical protein